MTKYFVPWIAILTAASVLGCGLRVPLPPSAATLRLADLERSQIERETVWGRGYVLPGGEHTLDLGAVPEGGAFRLSMLEDGEHPAPVHVRVWAGETSAAAFKSAGPEKWALARVDLSEKTGAQCRVRLECKSSFVLGTCELTGGTQAHPNILIFLIDTLRQDHAGCYGYQRDTTPNIDRFCEDAVQFKQLMPPSSWTRPSVASLLTATYPPTHGANDSLRMVRKNLPRLATALHDFGYETHGIVTNLNCLPLWNIGTEFDTHTDVDSTNWQHADDAKLVDRFLEMLPSLAGRPWLVYVHAMGPHAPYEPPGGFEDKFKPDVYEGTPTEIARRKALDLYDAEIAYTDAQFGRAVEELKRLGMYENTTILVLSDHGEEFWEHGGTDHGKTLYEEQLRVPFLWKLPGERFRGEQRDALVEMVDISPTLLDAVGAPPEPRFQGKSFWGYVNSGEIAPAIGFASLELNAANMQTAKTVEKKYIRDLGAGTSFWYDLAADPGEHHPISDIPPWGEELLQWTSRMEQRGRTGLHILVTRQPGTNHEVRCYVEAKRFGAYEMFFPYGRGGGMHEDNGVVFLIHLRDIEDPGHNRIWREAMGHDNAHLFVEVPKDEPVTLTVEKDGATVGPEDVYIGRATAPMALDHAVLIPGEIEAAWTELQPAEAAETFGVYVWYEAESGSVKREELDPDVRDVLRGHGYLGD